MHKRDAGTGGSGRAIAADSGIAGTGPVTARCQTCNGLSLSSAARGPERRCSIRCWSPPEALPSIELCAALIGPWLQEMGYLDADGATSRPANPHVRVMRAIYPRHFAAKHFLKTRTALGRVLTKTRVWTEQPRPGEDPVRPALAVPRARLVSDPPMVSR